MFQEYLYGKEFILETISLQEVGISTSAISAIYGRENTGADFFSRFPCDSDWQRLLMWVLCLLVFRFLLLVFHVFSLW